MILSKTRLSVLRQAGWWMASVLICAPVVTAQSARLGPPPPPIPASDYPARRAALLSRIDSGIVVVPGAREPIGHYPSFRQNPYFHYLTGFLEPDATLVLVKQGGQVTGTMFIEPPAPRTEFYTGTRVRYPDISRELGLTGRSNEEVSAMLDSLAGTHLPYYFVSDAESSEFIAPDSLSFGRALARRLAVAHPGLEIKNATPIVDSLRAKKSAAEIAMLKRAAEISDIGHRVALQTVAPEVNEYEVQAAMEYAFRRNGADRPGYSSIVGSGPNSTTLHYSKDERVMHAGEVVVMDVAAEYAGYSADLTRTLPVSGTFTPDERVIYQIVRDAQAAGERQVKPGVPAKQEIDSISAVIRKGLTKLGLIDSANAVFDAPPGFCRSQDNVCPQVALFYPHGPGHGIGLDVHDPAQFYTGEHLFGLGDAFTIEPGIYIRPSMIDVLPSTPRNQAFIARIKPLLARYANIGVRIEDDYVVTPNGVERLTSAPREIPEIEAAMKRKNTAADAGRGSAVGR